MSIEKMEQDLAGFGERVNKMSTTQARHDERIENNKEDIGDVKVDVKLIYGEIKEVNTNISSAVKWVITALAFPTLLLAYQLYDKQKPQKSEAELRKEIYQEMNYKPGG